VPVAPNGAAPDLTGPAERTEYFGPVAAGVFEFRSGYARQGGLAAEGQVNTAYRTSQVLQFLPGDARSQPWYGTPMAPGVDPGTDFLRAIGETDSRTAVGRCDLCRQGKYLFGYFPMVNGGVDNHQTGGSGVDEGTTTSTSTCTAAGRRWFRSRSCNGRCSSCPTPRRTTG